MTLTVADHVYSSVVVERTLYLNTLLHQGF